MTLPPWLLSVVSFGRAAVRRRAFEVAAAVCDLRAAQHKADADRAYRTNGDAGAAMALAVEAEACATAIRAAGNRNA